MWFADAVEQANYELGYTKMTYTHLAAGVQTSQHEPRVALYCDLQNVWSILEHADLLLAFAKSKGRLISKKVYYNSQCQNQASAKDKLKSLSCYCVDVPCPIKDSADNKMMVDCLGDIHSYLSPDIVILVSGDGDFLKLVLTLHQLGKKVIILAQKGNVKQKLKEVAKEFYFLDDLPQLVEAMTQKETDSVQCQIAYNQAIEYLLVAIQTALSKGEATNFSMIGNLMRQLYPCYKGVGSICKPDGKKFAKFSKFVDAAVKDGKVRMQNQELFLVEADKLAA
ncbi:NYN domain-containing protein [Microseira sp. BLCC-F43]|uniref:NYN domain-containing protein n=1 Tax=Microseira sp. BLCC-F43 TaxID=3153602 RepID=UPI0035B88FA1